MKAATATSLISVIMSTYDTREDYLSKAVYSILNQTYRNIELIVVVDGGGDDKYLSKIKDDRVKVLKHKNTLGLAISLNDAIAVANGEYIARMDSDDFSLPDRLAEQYKFMEEHPDVDICSMFVREFGDGEKIRLTPCIKDDYIQSELFINNVLAHPAIMFRKTSIGKYNIVYDSKYSCSQDYELWTRLAGTCKFAILPKVGLLYRIHNKQISSARKLEQKNFYRQTVSRSLKQLGLGADKIQYIEMLDGKITRKDVSRADGFVKECLSLNDNIKLYGQRAFKNVLYRHLFTSLLKNKLFLYSFKYLRWYDFRYVFEKIFLMQKCRTQLVGYRKSCRLVLAGKRGMA